MSRAMRAAVIGCGRIGSEMADDPLMAGDVFTHAEAYARSSATDLVATCDLDLARARRCSERWNAASAYDDIIAMLIEARPEVVSICTPDATHFAVARTLLERGVTVRAILCEKPLALELGEAQDLVLLARQRETLLAVVYMRRFAQNMQALQKRLRSGEFGAVRAVAGWYTKGVLHNGTHWFDLLRMLTGEIRWVQAFDAFRDAGPDKTLDVILGLENGAIATLRAVDHANFTIFEMEILTEQARIVIADSGHDIRLFAAGPSPRYSGYVELSEVPASFGHRRDLMLAAVEDVAAALQDRRPPACSGEDAVAALRIGTAALKAADVKQRVQIATV